MKKNTIVIDKPGTRKRGIIQIDDPYIGVPDTYIPDIDISKNIENAFQKYWNVIVWNDDIHTYEYVIQCLMKVLGIDVKTAWKHADTINNEGKDIVATETQEKAELYQEQLSALELTVTIARDS